MSDGRGRTRSRSAKVRDRSNSPMDRSRSHNNASANGTDNKRSRSPRDRSISNSRSRSPAGPRSAKIVIEKLTKNVNEGHLREIFSKYGEIEELEMPINRQFLTNRGIAYVLYATPDFAENAISHMHEAQLDGALINVSIVLPRRRFSRSPQARRPPPNRFGEAHRYREGPPERSYPSGPAGRGGRGAPPGRGGYGDRNDDRSYQRRDYSRSRISPRRSSPGGRNASRSRSPRRRTSPARDGRRRSPSYSSYSDDSRDQRRSRDRHSRR